MLELTLFAVLLSAVGAAPGTAPTDLTVNGLLEHDAASSPFPRDGPFVLSWSLAAVSMTSSLQLQIAEESAPTWTPFVVPTGDSSFALPANLTSTFMPDTTYRWRVLAGDSSSPAAFFDVAPADATFDSATWIGGASEVQANWTPPSSLVRARAYVAGLGLAELLINGVKVGDHIADPGEAVYDQSYLYVGFNVTDLLLGGQPLKIGARLGNGKFGYLDMFANRTAAGDQSGDSTRAFKLLITTLTADGQRDTFVSSAGAGSPWKMRHGPIVYDHLWNGVIYDSRRASAPWSEAAVEMSPKAGRASPQLMPAIRVIESYTPVKVLNPEPGQKDALLYDFGQNMAGFTTLTLDVTALRAQLREAQAADGAATMTMVAKLKHTEILDSGGDAYNNYFPGMEFGHASKTCSMPDWYARKWYECANQTDAFLFEVTSSPSVGNDTLSFTPSFTYHGFRYVELAFLQVASDGTEEPLDATVSALFPFGASLVAHRANSDLRKIATLGRLGSSGGSSAVIEGIFNVTLATHVSQLWSIPTDCPQREKRGWMADAGTTSGSLATFFDSLAFHSNFLRLIRDNQQKGCTDQPQTTINGPCKAPAGKGDPRVWFNGSVPDVTPFSTSPYGSNPGTTDWQMAYVQTAYTVLQYGVTAHPVLRELWDSLDLFMQYLDRLADPATGLLLQGARGDWVPPAGDGHIHTSADVISAFMHTLSVGHMADIAAAIGRTADAQRYATRLAANRKAYHARFWNQKQTGAAAKPCCYESGSDASNVFALHIGAVPDGLVSQTVDALVASLHNWRNRTGTTAQAEANGASPLPRWGTGAHMDCGLYGTGYIFDVLHAHGQDAVALEVLTETSYPSLGYMLTQGATTLWEAWDGTQHAIGKQGTSRNHIMFGGGAARYILSAVGGVGPASTAAGSAMGGGKAAGWHNLLLGPAPAAVRLLSHGGAERLTPGGPATVAWRISGGNRLGLNTTVPRLVSATVRVPLLDGLTTVNHRHHLHGGPSCVFECRGTVISGGDDCADYDAGPFLRAPTCGLTETGERVFYAEPRAGVHSFEAV